MSISRNCFYKGVVCKIEDNGFWVGQEEDESLLFFMLPLNKIRLGDRIAIDHGELILYGNHLDKLKFNGN